MGNLSTFLFKVATATVLVGIRQNIKAVFWLRYWEENTVLMSLVPQSISEHTCGGTV